MLTEANKTGIGRLFESNETFGSTMITVLLDCFGSVEFLDWEPQVLNDEIRTQLGGKITSRNSDKLQALCLCLTSNQFYQDINAFIGVCNSLAGDGADFKTFDPATVEEMAWAVTEVALLDGSTGTLADLFSDEIKEYIGLEAKREGFHTLPKPLTFGTGLKANYATMGDADMFAASFQDNAEMVKEVEEKTFRRLQAMTGQIGQLPLQHGDSEEWRKFSGRGLRRTA